MKGFPRQIRKGKYACVLSGVFGGGGVDKFLLIEKLTNESGEDLMCYGRRLAVRTPVLEAVSQKEAGSDGAVVGSYGWVWLNSYIRVNSFPCR